MHAIARHAEAAGGPDVSPSGSVPEYLDGLAPEVGHWWSACVAGTQGPWRDARGCLFSDLEPAIYMRWVHVAADAHGRRWYRLTDAGRLALEKLPAVPGNLPEPSMTDEYIRLSDEAFARACASEPRDTNQVHIPVSCSRWWTPKGGAA